MNTALDQNTEQLRSPMMLIVGDIEAWSRAGRDLPNLAGFHFVSFADVTPEVIAEIQPDIVLCSLFSDSFDAAELASLLSDCGFRGRFRALSDILPRPDTVIKEIRSHGPGVDFDLLILASD